METFSALLALCAGNTPVIGEFLVQRPMTRSFDVFLICAWINGWVNNREADLRRHRHHYDVTVMWKWCDDRGLQHNFTSHGRHGVSNHQQLLCYLTLVRAYIKKKPSKFGAIGTLWGESTSPVDPLTMDQSCGLSVDSPHKGLVTRKMCSWHDVIMELGVCVSITWASCQIRKIAGAHAPGMPGTFSPSLQASDPDMHHGTCVTHVPWCMLGSLTSGFLWNRRRGKTFPAFPAHTQPAILRIW